MWARGRRALRLTRDHKPSVEGESERIRGAGGELDQQCGPERPVFNALASDLYVIMGQWGLGNVTSCWVTLRTLSNMQAMLTKQLLQLCCGVPLTITTL